MGRWRDKKMNFEGNRADLQTWKTLLALLPRDFVVEPYFVTNPLLGLVCSPRIPRSPSGQKEGSKVGNRKSGSLRGNS
jgi:hypothetical protein